MTSEILIQRLRALTGQRFRYLDSEWYLIEVLGQEDALVLRQRNGGDAQVQTDQYGQANRRARQTLTLPLSDADNEGYSEEVLALLEGRLRE
jgi:hypothetical protein